MGRTTDELTSYAGYGGARASVGKEGKLCYHNMRGISDYGKAGAGEVRAERAVDVLVFNRCCLTVQWYKQ